MEDNSVDDDVQTDDATITSYFIKPKSPGPEVKSWCYGFVFYAF